MPFTRAVTNITKFAIIPNTESEYEYLTYIPNTEWKFSYRIPNTNTEKYRTTNIEYEYSNIRYSPIRFTLRTQATAESPSKNE